MQNSAIAPILVVLACLSSSCQKIQEPAQSEANLKIATAPFTDAVPAAYGQLVSVTAGSRPYSAVMWFRKPDESIVAVQVNYARGALGSNILEIPRKIEIKGD